VEIATDKCGNINEQPSQIWSYVLVNKKEKNMERSKRNQVVGRGDRGRQISKKEGSWTSQQEEKSTIGFFGAPHEKEGKTGWRSPENTGQVDLGF
jgi:hypothetical protein